MKEMVNKLELPINIPFGRDVCMLIEIINIKYWLCSIRFTLWNDEENKEDAYSISVNRIIAYQSIPFESSGYLEFCNESSFNEVMNSKWIDFIKKNTFDDVVVLEGARHYRMMFYEEVIEVIAREKPEIIKIIISNT